VAAVDGRLTRVGAVRVVYSKRPGDPRKEVRAAVVSYERRWAVEVLFKELKGPLGPGG
jgi:hypothetical protein